MTNDEINAWPFAQSGTSFSSFGFWTSSLIRRFGFRNFFAIALLLSACNKTSTAPASQPANPTIASMVPAATDLIVGMGARNRLVAVSTYDNHRPDVGNLPKAGDYETVDWEMLRTLHPSILVCEIQPERQSPGFKTNAADLHIAPLNVKIEQLSDIFSAIDSLGDALKEPELATNAKAEMQARLKAVQQSNAGLKPVSTLIVIDASGDAVVGAGTYLEDLLKLAGGTNAAAKLQQHWPQIDREMLLLLKPDAIIQLLPDATLQERDQAIQTWKRYPQIPAVAAGRVYPIYETYALLPGWHVTDLAEQFSRCLHPTQPTTKP